MNTLAHLRPYLPFALRIATTVAAFLAPIVAAKEPFSIETLAAAALAGSAAWKRWHPPASLSATFAAKP